VVGDAVGVEKIKLKRAIRHGGLLAESGWFR
jgi:hypothetical protein